MAETPLHLVRTHRFVPAVAERAINAALSRGPGYEPLPPGSAFDAASVRGYYTDFRSKTTATHASDVGTLLPTTHIQLALGWWERHVHGDGAALERFLELCASIERRAHERGDELRWPIGVALPKYGLRPGWCSALTQAQGASTFVRAHLATADDRYAELALRAVRPLLASRRSELLVDTGAGPLLEEAPSRPRSAILNGWIAGLWGLWDVGQGLAVREANEDFAAGVESLRDHLRAYDTGWWTRYSLYPHALADLAKPFYHRLHVDQLVVLHRLSGVDELARTASRWAAYDNRRNRTLAVAQKALFALADAPRRRR